MARRSVLASDDESTEINLSAMIDCIFILLIFFIVTTVFVEEKGMSVNKPDAAAAASDEEQESVVFTITADDKILFDDQEIGLAAVGQRVKQNLKNDETPVMIRAHERSDHGVFVSVWDAAKVAGAKTLSFSTIN